MSSLVHAGMSRIRRTFAWSNSRESWHERLCVLLLLAGTALWWWYGGAMTLGPHLLVATLLVAAAGVMLRQGWLRLFGPVLLYELIRLGRRGRYFFFRTLYAGFLMFLLCWIYLIWLLDSSDNGRINPRDMAD